MNKGTREAISLSEVLQNKSCMIDHYNLYINNCQEPQLSSILERQQRHALDSFQKLLQMMQNHGLDTSKIPLPSNISTSTSSTHNTYNASGNQYSTQQWITQQYGTGGQTTTDPYTSPYGSDEMGMSTQNQTRTQSTGFNFSDRVISEGALLFHKCSAETHTRAALESSEPHIRNALTSIARNSIEMSYELYNYISQMGWYQSPPNTQNFISHSPAQQQQQQSPPQ